MKDGFYRQAERSVSPLKRSLRDSSTGWCHAIFSDTVILIDYARRKYAAERWPRSTELRAVREPIEKLEPMPLRPVRPYEPSMLTQKRRRR
jgi:hypothetical protein